ncbi:MAG: trigger factor, partial [Eubacteriales bacterium]|nr:trigger factor [Eubacteriales bacterium]
EEKDITVKFPEDYHAENLKGKDAVFAVKVKTVQVKELPELDDEFAKDISEFDTLEAWKTNKREELEKQAKERAEAEQENDAIEKVVENAAVEIPHVMIHRQMDYMLQDMAYRLSMSGISMEDYCKYLGTDVETIRAGYHAEAEARVKMQLVIGAVSKAENVEANDADVDAELEKYAPQTGKSPEEFKKTLSPDDIQYFKDRIVAQKTVKLIMDNAKLVAAKKAPAKKAAAKTGEEAEVKKTAAKKPAAKKKTADTEAAAKDAE